MAANENPAPAASGKGTSGRVVNSPIWPKPEKK